MLAITTATGCWASDALIYLDESAPIEQRVEDALSRMTTQEKVGMVHGWSKFMVSGVPRLGIPELNTSDGPHGVRAETSWTTSASAGWESDSCTAFPCDMCLSASWNTSLAYDYGKALGEEMRYRKKEVALGPAVNIYRSPLCARNMEYMGEDPYLTGEIATPYILGLQTNGVAACVKHFALNNQERNRHTVDVRVSDRALYEIYLPAFKKAIMEGNSWSIMASYNLWNGTHCCHNSRLLIDILRKEWGFEGVVFSDWNGTHDTDEAIHNGLDIEMGTKRRPYYLAEPYLEKINSGEVGTEELDEKVRHILRLHFLTSMNTSKPWGSMCTKEHSQVAYNVASEGIVLLKNEGNILPIKPEVKNILVVGENAIRIMTIGGGSSTLKTKYEVTPIEGLLDRCKTLNQNITYARGYVGDTASTYDGYKSRVSLFEERTPEQLIAEAVEKAEKADLVIFVGGLNKNKYQEREGWDRKSYSLPYGQDELMEALLRVNKNIVFVGLSGNAYAIPWANEVPAIVQSWYLGSEAGNAIADVLLGNVNPSGKLPFSWMKQLNDYPAHALNAFDTTQNVVETYAEDIFLGYRYTDQKKSPKPLFAFGYGLSYTNFEYANCSIAQEGDKWQVKVDVTNVGKCAGKEIVQLYISDLKCSVLRPVKELKAFQKVALASGETATVSFEVTRDDLAFFDAVSHAWVTEPGQFQVLIGAASNDIRTKQKFTLK